MSGTLCQSLATFSYDVGTHVAETLEGTALAPWKFIGVSMRDHVYDCSWRRRRTEEPGRLLRGQVVNEEPPRGLEREIALDGRHALVLRRELILVSSSEWRTLRRVVRVQRVHRGELVLGCVREEVIVNECLELVVVADERQVSC